MRGYADIPSGHRGLDAADWHETAGPAAQWPLTTCERCWRAVRWGVLWAWLAPTADDEDAPREAFVGTEPEPGGDYRVWVYLPNPDRSVWWPLLVPAITGGAAYKRHACPVGVKAPEDELVAR